jgi:transcriptional regulator NrdR family protein
MVEANINSEPIYKKAFHLPIETVVYIPSTNKEQQPVSREDLNKRVAEVRKFLSRINGGYTSTNATGGYVMKGGELVKEDVVKVTSFATVDAFNKNKNKVHRKLRLWGKRWGQESMGYEYEGDMYYV